MALAKFQKIQLIAISQHKDKILEILQTAGVFEAASTEDESAVRTSEQMKDLQKAELIYANTEFAIKLLSQYHTKEKGESSQAPVYNVEEVNQKVKNFDSEKITAECSEVEEELTQAKNAIATAKTEIETLTPWKNLKVRLENLDGTETAGIILGKLKTQAFPEAVEEIHKLSELISTDVVSQTQTDTYFTIVFEKELEQEIREVLTRQKFIEAELKNNEGTVSKHIEDLHSLINDNEKTLKIAKDKLVKLSKHLPDLKIANDYAAWQQEKHQTALKLINTDSSFAAVGWIPTHNLEPLKETLEKATNEYEIFETAPEEGEKPPVLLKNNKFMEPFEAVTRVYGLPRHDEIDPTPFLSAYFIIFFAMCLTDAGYGIIMFAAMWWAQKKFNLEPSVLKLVRLLMYGGIATFIIGALFGGWFGLTPEQVPAWMTTLDSNGEPAFIFQTINALKSPITVLIIAFAFGYIQVLMGVFMKLFHGLKTGDKKETLLDTGSWAYMLTVIGFKILVAAGVLPAALDMASTYILYSGVLLLILTQGRDKKNIIMKVLGGVLSLYDLVGYLSDILSYSRILALGLATAIIGLAVNIVTELVWGLPYIGWLIGIAIFIGGHIFNLLLNALGSFIHSGRLQFVEFFTKFMEGGGKDFKPFSKKSKYLFLKN